MVKDHLLDNTGERLLSENFSRYTTLRSRIQRAAAAAVDCRDEKCGLLLAKRYDKWRPSRPEGKQRRDPAGAGRAVSPLDPRTGEIKQSLAGAITAEQLNHALARRQPGSVFKRSSAAALTMLLTGCSP